MPQNLAAYFLYYVKYSKIWYIGHLKNGASAFLFAEKDVAI